MRFRDAAIAASKASSKTFLGAFVLADTIVYFTTGANARSDELMSIAVALSLVAFGSSMMTGAILSFFSKIGGRV